MFIRTVTGPRELAGGNEVITIVEGLPGDPGARVVVPATGPVTKDVTGGRVVMKIVLGSPRFPGARVVVPTTGP